MASRPLLAAVALGAAVASPMARAAAAAKAAEAAEAAQPPKEGSVRLAGGNTDAGRVEVYTGGRWGWICLGDDGDKWQRRWGKPAAEVVCRQLGLRAAVGTMRMANGRTGELLPIAGAFCNGTEASLLQCRLDALSSAGPGARCHEDAAQPAAAAVRCTNFVPEEQPAVKVDETQAPLAEVIRDPYLRIACDAKPRVPPEDSVERMPTFSCAVVKEPQEESDSADEGRCAVDAAGGGGGRCAAHAGAGRGADDGPFAESSAEAFVFKDLVRDDLAAARRRLSDAAAARGAAAYAMPPGLRASAIGLELENSTLDAPGLARARRDLLSPLGRVMLDLDAEVAGLTGQKAEVARALPEASAAADIFDRLEDAGVAWLGDLGLPEEVHAEAMDALGDVVHGGKLAASARELPSLERWLRGNSTLQAAIVAYLGGHGVLHGYKVVHLPATLSPKSFISAHWHHDRAGRRLKLFVLLNDVNPEEGHPTQVAEGSHRVTYYWQEEFQQSRYDDDYVRRNFRTTRLAGGRGSGYLFDTNTIHKGTPEGSQGRNVIVIEYHHAAKCGLVAQLGLNLPCPSGDQRPLNWYLSAGADS